MATLEPRVPTVAMSSNALIPGRTALRRASISLSKRALKCRRSFRIGKAALGNAEQ
jgi:hypothetical protein